MQTLDRGRLLAMASSHAASYANAHPFPHVVIDDFLPAELAEMVLAEFPAPDEAQWMRFDSNRERKLASIDDAFMGPTTRRVLAELNSATAIDFLEELTGIIGLGPDPHFFGGGQHQILNGGMLE